MLVVMNPPANAEDEGSILGQEDSPGGGNGKPSILAYRFPWTEEPRGVGKDWTGLIN